MLTSWLKQTNCHSCQNTIGPGQLFCKTCGRSRGINGVLQFKKWELIIATFGSSILICLLFAALSTMLINIRNSPVVTDESPNTNVSAPPLISETDSPPPATATQRPSNTRTPRPTTTPESNFASYSCPDKSKIKLRVGDRAMVAFYDMNLRSSPKVPDVWDANIVITLHEGNEMSVIGGPECAHDGTWWEVQTDSGYTGWVREMQPNKVLLEPIK
jgi:hypothetical protein